MTAALRYSAVETKLPVCSKLSAAVLASLQEQSAVINYCFLAILPGNNFYNNDKKRNKFCHYRTAFITLNVAGSVVSAACREMVPSYCEAFRTVSKLMNPSPCCGDTVIVTWVPLTFNTSASRLLRWGHCCQLWVPHFVPYRGRFGALTVMRLLGSPPCQGPR